MTWAQPPVSTRWILACRDTLAAGLSTQHSGCDPDPDHGIEPLPNVTVMAFLAPPAVVVPIRATGLPTLHDDALEMAWCDGAWDVDVTFHSVLRGPDLGLVARFRDFSADPGLLEILMDAAERGRLATWYWRPMRNGPSVRVKAHAAKDATLEGDGGRSGKPVGLRAPRFAWGGYGTTLIRLGRAADGLPLPHGMRARPATVNQRGYLGRLLRLGGQNDRLPSGLTLAEASSWIDRLKAQLS